MLRMETTHNKCYYAYRTPSIHKSIHNPYYDVSYAYFHVLYSFPVAGLLSRDPRQHLYQLGVPSNDKLRSFAY